MTPPAVATAVHCPACARWLTEAVEMKGVRLRCKSCGTRVVADLADGDLHLALDKETMRG